MGGHVGDHHGGMHKPDRPYQRDRHRKHRPAQYNVPQVSGSYFQRPYPYHLDYYRMRWGGSYAPYFGNLYGPPNVELGVTPYFNGGGYYYDGAPAVPFDAAPTPME